MEVVAQGQSLQSNIAPSAPKSDPPLPVSPFQRMDSGESQATLLKANPHEVTVGVRDTALGWLEIQTQSTAGHVSASLVAASPEAHARLVAEAPALTQYMTEHNVPVQSVSVAMQGNGSEGGQQRPDAEDAPRQERTPRAGQVQALNHRDDEAQLSLDGNSRISVRA
jgi:hypothetical protein